MEESLKNVKPIEDLTVDIDLSIQARKVSKIWCNRLFKEILSIHKFLFLPGKPKFDSTASMTMASQQSFDKSSLLFFIYFFTATLQYVQFSHE
jgi:hypothetical protein